MNKKQLKALIAGLIPTDKVSVTFLDELAPRTGDYEVTRTSTGRGKGGSQLMHLKNADGVEFKTGTPESDKILHVVTSDGTLHGYETTADVPRSFETDVSKHLVLKCQMQKLVSTIGARIRVEDSQNEFGEEYTVTQAEQLRGRYGQVKFALRRDDGTYTSLWSFRHSGIVTSFEILSVPTQDTIPTSAEENTDENF